MAAEAVRFVVLPWTFWGAKGDEKNEMSPVPRGTEREWLWTMERDVRRVLRHKIVRYGHGGLRQALDCPVRLRDAGELCRIGR